MWKKMLLRKRRKKAKPIEKRSPLVVAMVAAGVAAELDVVAAEVDVGVESRTCTTLLSFNNILIHSSSSSIRL
jgi:hypothetical protein